MVLLPTPRGPLTHRLPEWIFCAVALTWVIASVTTRRRGSVPSMSLGGAFSPILVSNSAGCAPHRCASPR
jgi:hypothetical protein